MSKSWQPFPGIIVFHFMMAPRAEIKQVAQLWQRDRVQR